ncbi:hypothetical protein SAMN05444422_10940 [Halobiforma haloterrestris]|uniref:Uncharacterized protein n=1 Tax=Natronobacterium haloterrestre TaxID=148448 RepID=A0A1I1JJ23_NATHA|nr:hypothetical protein [Halobiforma haloterrestris]SFC48554.1 hypothetical protein SAMN05444422_10940 [Halobiforma haloterrestris]
MYQSRPTGKRQSDGQPRPNRSLRRRVEAVEHNQRLLRNTLSGLARERGVSVGCECSRCNRAYLLVAKHVMYCPSCGYDRGL